MTALASTRDCPHHRPPQRDKQGCLGPAISPRRRVRRPIRPTPQRGTTHDVSKPRPKPMCQGLPRWTCLTRTLRSWVSRASATEGLEEMGSIPVLPGLRRPSRTASPIRARLYRGGLSLAKIPIHLDIRPAATAAEPSGRIPRPLFRSAARRRHRSDVDTKPTTEVGRSFAISRLPTTTATGTSSSSPALVPMVQTADHRERHDLSPLGSLHLSPVRRVLVETEMATGFVVVGRVIVQQPT